MVANLPGSMHTSGFLRRVPKIQLHCHLEGTLRAATFLELSARSGAPPVPSDLDEVYRFADFGEFLLTFAAVSRLLRDPEDYGRLASEYAHDAAAQRVRYAEVFISPSVWQFFHPSLDVRACVAAMRAEFDAARCRDGLDVRLICDLTRNFGAEAAMRTAHLAVSLTDLGVIGVGLGGDEARYPARLFEAPFAFARAHGLHAVAHAGEADGPESVRGAIEVLGAERIGHGIRALESREVLELVTFRGVPLEICPTSNFLTGVVSRDRPHPLLELDAAGAIVAIDADDPALFRTSITDEYAYVAGIAGEATLRRFVRNAIDASFAEDDVKRMLGEQLRSASVEPSAERRS